jgi:hypothetical protein
MEETPIKFQICKGRKCKHSIISLARSLLFIYLEDRETKEKLVLGIICVLQFSVHRMLEMHFSAIHIQ